jgi:hypothetical protein
MKPHEKLLGHNPLSDALYRNLDMILNGQGTDRGASYLDLDTVLSEQVSSHRILSDMLHHRWGVVKNK